MVLPGSVTSRSTKAACAPNKPNKSKPSKPTSTKTIHLAPTNLDSTVRLHITPLTPTLIPTLIPQSLFDDTANYPPPVSYHTLEVLPDKSYGYVDLSPQLAQKLTTRLNGTVFRGVKVSVQKARPRTWIPLPVTSTDPDNSHKNTVSEHEIDQEGRLPEKKKRKKEDGIHPGIELPSGRWVKRAWTKAPITGTMGKPKDKKDKKETRKEDIKKSSLLFQTTLPPTIPTPTVTDPKALKKLEKRKRAIAAAEATAAAESSSSDSGGSERREGKKKRKMAKIASKVKPPRDKITIKEFTSNTKFPGFLKTSQLDPSNKRDKVTQFVEGMGWIDGEGQLVDDSAVKKAVTKRKNVLGARLGQVEVELEVSNESRQRMKEEIKRRSSDDDEEMEDAYMNSESPVSDPESESESNLAEAAEKAQSKGEIIGKSSEPVCNHNAGNSSSKKSDPESLSDFRSEQKDIDEDAGRKHKETAAFEKSTLSIARKSHKSGEESGTSSISSSPGAKSDFSEGSGSGNETSHNDESSGGSEGEDESEIEDEGEEEEENRYDELKSTKTQVTLRAPSLKLSIPTESTSEANKPHPLEALFKSTTDVGAGASGRGLFNFSFADDDDDEDTPAETFGTSNSRPYRSAAPTPDTAVASKTIKWPDLAKISPFEPTSPIAPRKLSLQQAPTTVPVDLDAPLLFQNNVDSAYLRSLSILSGGHLPEAKTLTELPPDEEEEEVDPEAPKKKRKGNANEVAIGKHKERKVGQGSAVASRGETRKEIWKERFFKYRGEWNREWKNKKREVGKLARRKQRERGTGSGGNMAIQ